jgi:hypothetical protein
VQKVGRKGEIDRYGVQPKKLDDAPNIRQYEKKTNLKPKGIQITIPEASISQDVNNREPPAPGEKTFSIGFQFFQISKFAGIELSSVRLIITDKFSDNRKLSFTTSATEPGVIEGTHGWQFCFYHQIPDLLALRGRSAVFEIVT